MARYAAMVVLTEPRKWPGECLMLSARPDRPSLTYSPPRLGAFFIESGTRREAVTKRWSSTKSLDGQTKRQASKSIRRDFAREILKADKEPPELETRTNLPPKMWKIQYTDSCAWYAISARDAYEAVRQAENRNPGHSVRAVELLSVERGGKP